MSKSFNINLFKSSVSAFCAEKAERPHAFATFLADNLASALESTLIDGSDAINQAFLILTNAGKGLNPFDFRALLLLLRGDYLHSFSDLALLFASFVRRRAAVYVLGVGEAKAA